MPERNVMIKELDQFEMKFVEEFLQHGNASEAFRKTGLQYNHNSVARRGHEMKQRPHVAAEIAFRMRSEVMNANEVLFRLSNIARGSIGDYIEINEDGSWNFDLLKAKEGKRLGVVKSIQMTRYGTKVELHDPMKALELIGKAHALWVDVKSNEDWQSAAVRDIRSGKIDAWDIMTAFKDELLVMELYGQAGEEVPEQFLLEIGKGSVEDAE